MKIFRDMADRGELATQYSPSSCVTDLNAILREYADRSAGLRANRAPQVISYGSHAAETLDYFAVPAGGAPLVVYVHGGYWQELSKNEHSFPAEALARHGIAYAAVNYGLAPEAKLEAMVDRCRRAIRWIAAHSEDMGVEPGELHLIGCSAGAHLAAMTMLSVPAIRSLTLMSGIFDLRPLTLTYVNDAVGMTLESAQRNSPQFLLDQVTGQLPRTLIVWGEHETSEFKRQSLEFADALTRKGAAVQAEEIGGRNHFDLLFDLGDESTRFGALTLEQVADEPIKKRRVP